MHDDNNLAVQALNAAQAINAVAQAMDAEPRRSAGGALRLGSAWALLGLCLGSCLSVGWVLAERWLKRPLQSHRIGPNFQFYSAPQGGAC